MEPSLLLILIPLEHRSHILTKNLIPIEDGTSVASCNDLKASRLPSDYHEDMALIYWSIKKEMSDRVAQK